jgi:hypothetical protein
MMILIKTKPKRRRRQSMGLFLLVFQRNRRKPTLSPHREYADDADDGCG